MGTTGTTPEGPATTPCKGGCGDPDSGNHLLNHFSHSNNETNNEDGVHSIGEVLDELLPALARHLGREVL